MGNNLLFDFSKVLDKESDRISNILWEKYKNHEKINMSFEDAVRMELKKAYQYYDIDIVFRVFANIPKELDRDPDNEYVFISKEEADLKYATQYSNYCLKNKTFGKNPKRAANKFANMLVEMNEKNELNCQGLLPILAKTMNILYPVHNDSEDVKAIMLYLQDAIEKKGYKIENIDPLILKKC